MLDRYWAKVDTSGGPDACWLWTGGCQRYGIFWGGDRRADGAPIMVKAHRWTFEEFVGAVPDGLEVCHTCDNPPCVNPAHLFLGTHSDNMRDMVSKGRGAYPAALIASEPNRGEANGCAVVTEAIVREIRRRYAGRNCGISQQALADEFGLTQTAVSAIIRRKNWRHVE